MEQDHSAEPGGAANTQPAPGGPHGHRRGPLCDSAVFGGGLSHGKSQ